MLCCLTAAVMLLATGCGSRVESQKTGSGQGSAGQQTTMGRYVESEEELPIQLEGVCGFCKMDDGKLVILGRKGEVLISEEDGSAWKSSERQWFKENVDDAYIMDVKMDSKGTMGILYAENDNTGSEEAAFAEQISLKCILLLPDETVIPVRFPTAEEEEGIDRFWISNTDRYFVSAQDGSIYEVHEDGSSVLYLRTEGSPQTIQFLGNLMIIDGYDFKAPLLYDMEQEACVEDEVLAEFVQDNYADRGFNGAGWQNMCLFPGEENVLYVAGKKGLHRHVTGGGAMEQIIDGRLSRLGNPQYGIAGMVFLDTGAFLAVSDQGKLIRFTYDPDKEAVPQERLKVYSLQKDVDLYAAVSFYQIQNPDVFVEYEVGMEEGEAVTREDAIKKLNTKIMAGEGPDILMLDGLPVDSYLEKGVLCELDELVVDLEQETYGNVLRAFEKDGGIYMVPGQISFPIMMGKKSDVSGIKGLTALADRIEQMRREAPGKDLIGLCSEKAIMKLCSLISVQEWRTEDGEMNRAALEEFLTQAKRIYEAQMDGIAQSSIERFQETDEYYVQYVDEDWMYDLRHYGFYMDYLAEYFNIFMGVNFSPQSYMELTSISRAEGFEDRVFVPMERAEGSVFLPETILGINSATQKRELAEDFLKAFLGKENQSRLSGYAVNRAALDEMFRMKERENGADGEYGKAGIVYEDGSELILDLFLPTDEEITVIKGWMETAGIPYLEDTVFEECVFEEGSRFLLGEQGIGETLDAVGKRLAVYLAE